MTVIYFFLEHEIDYKEYECLHIDFNYNLCTFSISSMLILHEKIRLLFLAMLFFNIFSNLNRLILSQLNYLSHMQWFLLQYVLFRSGQSLT